MQGFRKIIPADWAEVHLSLTFLWTGWWHVQGGLGMVLEAQHTPTTCYWQLSPGLSDSWGMTTRVPTPSRVCSASLDAPTLLQACSPSIPHVHLVTSSITSDVMLMCDVMMFMCDTMLAQTLGFTGCLWWQWKNRSICPGVEVQKTSLCSLLLLPFHNLSSGTGLTLWGPLLCPMALEGDQSEHTPPCQGQNCSLYRCWAAFSAHGCPVCLADSWHHR